MLWGSGGMPRRQRRAIVRRRPGWRRHSSQWQFFNLHRGPIPLTGFSWKHVQPINIVSVTIKKQTKIGFDLQAHPTAPERITRIASRPHVVATPRRKVLRYRDVTSRPNMIAMADMSAHSRPDMSPVGQYDVTSRPIWWHQSARYECTKQIMHRYGCHQRRLHAHDGSAPRRRMELWLHHHTTG